MKADQEINLQIMAYLDGELNKADARRIEQLIKEDAEYGKIYQSLRDVQEVTQEMKFKKLPEMYWDEYWKHVYNRIERGFSWIFISVGAISVRNGLMTQMHFINDLIPELFRRSQRINVLVDSSKFYKLCTFQISPLKPSFTIFSDKGLPQEIRNEIETKGLKLVI